MKSRSLFSGALLFLFTCMIFSVPAFGQANSGKAVIHLGGSYSKALVDDAGAGFFGGDVFAGKMITNELCVGFTVGYDIVHYETNDFIDPLTNEPESFNERLAMIPFLVKAKYYLTLSPMVQVYGAAGGGVYRSVASLGGGEVGTIKTACNSPGGAISVGLDYWFLLTTGVGFEVEYHMFKVPEGDMFSYFQARVDYCLIKF